MDFVFDLAKDKIDSGNIKDRALVAEELLQIICKIENSIIRGYYIQEVARILKIKPNDLRDRVNKIRIDKRKHKARVVDSPIQTEGIALSSTNPLEEYCLWLLLQYPNLRSDGMKLNEDCFEYSENREIFLKWQKSTDVNSLKNNLDSTLHQYLDGLLNKVFRPTIKEDEVEQYKILHDCMTSLQEKLIRKLEAKKREILAMEAEAGGGKADLAKLDELGSEESKQLKRIFVEQSQRRHSTI